MGERRPTICLSMIVKNEAHVLRRCLRSVKPFITHWAISDTGSTDGTQAVIREELEGVPGELIERPWVDFSTNRNEALELARAQGADWLLVIDADEQLIPDAGFTLEALEADTYSVWFNIDGTEGRWFRKLLLHANVPLVYRGTMDEYLDDRGLDNRVLENCLVRSYTEGARSKDGIVAKFNRDVETLKAAIEREPEEPRNWYYLGQRLGGAGRYEEAIEALRSRLALATGFEEERYASLLQIAQYKEYLGHSPDELAAAYLAAYQERPTRAEPLIGLAFLHSNQRQWATAELYARAAARLPRPVDTMLVMDEVYAWGANDTLAGILCEQGKLAEARELLTKLVALPQCPEAQRERIRQNIALIRTTEGVDFERARVATLGPDEQAYTEQAATARKQGLAGLRKMARQFISRPALQSLPSPMRWAWLAAFGRAPWLPVAAAALCLPALAWAAPGVPALAWLLAALSPLLWASGRRKLQDTTVALVTLLALGCGWHGSALGLGLSVALLLGLKEAAVFALPAISAAWLLAGHSPAALAVSLGAGAVTWLAVSGAIFGKMTLPMLRAAKGGHATPYTLAHQRGAPHRLLVDLALVSPVATLLAVIGASVQPALAAVTAILVAAHALAPVRNVRLILAAELLIRALGAVALATFSEPVALTIFALWVTADALIYWRLRRIYDPTTAALAGELGMTRIA